MKAFIALVRALIALCQRWLMSVGASPEADHESDHGNFYPDLGTFGPDIAIWAVSSGRRREWHVMWRPRVASMVDHPESALYRSRLSLINDMGKILTVVRELDSDYPPVDITRFDETITIGVPEERRVDERRKVDVPHAPERRGDR